jgi:transcriptional regulator GlxA family with amidase domain
MPTPTKKIHVYALLLPDSLLLDTVGPVEVLQYANRLGGTRFVMHFVGPEQEIDNSIGLPVTVTSLPQQVEKEAWVLVPGMMGEHINLQGTTVNQACSWLSQHQFERIISVCGGALMLAKAGLLVNKKCTTHYMHIEQLRELLDEQ